MTEYYTADWHLGHPNIIRYCNRPYIRAGDLDEEGRFVSQEAGIEAARRMNDDLIHRSNQRVKDSDHVKHVGDFCTIGRAHGVDGERTKYDGYLSLLNGRWTLIEGNHDPNNKTKTSSVATIDRIGGLLVFVSHYPTDNPVHDPELIYWVSRKCAFAVCGHIHKAWPERWIRHGERDMLNINVGVDVRKYAPVTSQEVVGIYHRSANERKRHIESGP